MQRLLLLNVVVGERAPVLELLALEDNPLLVGRDASFVEDLHAVRRGGWFLRKVACVPRLC